MIDFFHKYILWFCFILYRVNTIPYHACRNCIICKYNIHITNISKEWQRKRPFEAEYFHYSPKRQRRDSYDSEREYNSYSSEHRPYRDRYNYQEEDHVKALRYKKIPFALSIRINVAFYYFIHNNSVFKLCCWFNFSIR